MTDTTLDTNSELRTIWSQYEDAIVEAINTAKANGENLEYHLDTPVSEFSDAILAWHHQQLEAKYRPKPCDNCGNTRGYEDVDGVSRCVLCMDVEPADDLKIVVTQAELEAKVDAEVERRLKERG